MVTLNKNLATGWLPTRPSSPIARSCSPQCNGSSPIIPSAKGGGVIHGPGRSVCGCVKSHPKRFAAWDGESTPTRNQSQMEVHIEPNADTPGIDPGLVAAYRATHYHVHGAVSFTLFVDQPSADLAGLHREFGTECSAFVTACNPGSHLLDPVENACLHAELGARLARAGYCHLEGLGRHPSNGWPAEPGYLVLGLSLEDAAMLGRETGQNAIVWSSGDAVPRLILLR